MKKKITNNLLLLALLLISANFSYGQCINEDFVAFADWTNVGTATDNDPLHFGLAAPCRAIGIGDSLTSPSVDNPNLLEFHQDASAGGNGMNTTVEYRIGGVVGTWTTLYTFAVSTAGVNEILDLTNILGVPDLSVETGVEFRFNSTFNTWYLDDVKVTCRTKVDFALTASSVTEGIASIDVCVSIINPDPTIATQVEIALDPSSTAINGTDYNNGVMTTPITFPQTITFPAGSSVDQCVTIFINDDSIIEPDETILLFLQNASGGNVAQIPPSAGSPFHTVTILDNDVLCAGGITTWQYDLFTGILGWTNGVPNNTMHAIIDFPYNTSIPYIGGQSIDACVLEVKTGGLTITAGKYVKVVNDIFNESAIIVEDDASLVQVNDNATVTGIGTFTTQVKTTTLQDADRFTYFSSPTENSTLAQFNSFAGANWGFDGTTQQWQYLGSSTATDLMQIGSGYAIQGGSGNIETINFSGKFNNGEVLIPLSNNVYNDIDNDGLGGDVMIGGVITPGSDPFPDPAATDDDSNFVGNPYPSAISVDNLINSNSINAVYIWTHGSAVGTTQANPWINNDYIECTVGTCTNLNTTVNTYNGFIASGQGFFVTAAAATNLVFNNSMRTIGNNDQFRTPNLNDEKLWLDFSTPQGYSKQIALTFTNNGTSGFDNKYEAKTIGNSYGLGFYSFNAVNDKLSINNSGLLDDERIIPLGFYINATIIDNATISINHLENLENVNIYLKDNLLNTLHDLKVSDYQLPITQTGEVNDRFEIIFNRNVLSANNEIIANDILVVSNTNEAQINVNMLDGSIITNIKAFDVLGKLVVDMKPNANNFVINTNIKRGQVLFFKATLENGQVLSNKFMKL